MEVEGVESSTKNGPMVRLDDDSDSERDGSEIQKQAGASSLRDKVDDMVKSKEKLVHKTLDTNILIAEKKIEEKKTRWQAI
jgi:hypothetical protein